MDLTFSRALLGPPGGDTINFMFGDLGASGPDIMNIKVRKGDISYAAGIVMKDHGYTVGQPEGETPAGEEDQENGE